MTDVGVYRTVATRVAPDPARVREFAERINASRNPVLVYGADIARSQAWEAGVSSPRGSTPRSGRPRSARPFPRLIPLVRYVAGSDRAAQRQTLRP